MGYRHYFYLVDKSKCEAVKNMTLNELCDYAKSEGVEVEDGWFYFNDEKFLDKKRIFEFGKFSTIKRLHHKLYCSELTTALFTLHFLCSPICPHKSFNASSLKNLSEYAGHLFWGSTHCEKRVQSISSAFFIPAITFRRNARNLA